MLSLRATQWVIGSISSIVFALNVKELELISNVIVSIDILHQYEEPFQQTDIERPLYLTTGNECQARLCHLIHIIFKKTSQTIAYFICPVRVTILDSYKIIMYAEGTNFINYIVSQGCRSVTHFMIRSHQCKTGARKNGIHLQQCV